MAEEEPGIKGLLPDKDTFRPHRRDVGAQALPTNPRGYAVRERPGHRGQLPINLAIVAGAIGVAALALSSCRTT